MRVLLLGNFGGDGELDIAMRAKAAGHDVKFYYTRTDRTKDFGRGLVTVINDWRPWMRWADLVILSDNTKNLREIDAWRRRENIPVVGATSDAAAWELNRTLGQKVLKDAGIDVAPYKEFSDYDAAIAYVKRENRRMVSKPIGDEPDKALSYCAKSPEDMVYMLQRWKKAQKLKGKFILQDFIPGIEMAVGGWFGPGGFNEGWHENFEFKKMMAGDIGCNTGEMGSAFGVFKRSKLADKVLKPLEDDLYRLGYCGYIDINCIIDENGTPWPLEHTCRPGWPSFNIQQALLKGDPIEWLADLVAGKDARNWKLGEVAIGVVMAIGDFPHSHITRKEVVNVPVYFAERDRDNIHFCEVQIGIAPTERGGKIVDAPAIVTAGDYVLVCTGSAKTVREAADAAYRVVDRINIPGSVMYRNDIGRRLARQIPKLAEMGYATGWAY